MLASTEPELSEVYNIPCMAYTQYSVQRICLLTHSTLKSYYYTLAKGTRKDRVREEIRTLKREYAVYSFVSMAFYVSILLILPTNDIENKEERKIKQQKSPLF